MTGLFPTIQRTGSLRVKAGAAPDDDTTAQDAAQHTAIHRNYESLSRVYQAKQAHLDKVLAALKGEQDATTALGQKLEASTERCASLEAQLAALAALPGQMEALRRQMEGSEAETAKVLERSSVAAARCDALQSQLTAKEATAAVVHRELQASLDRQQSLSAEVSCLSASLQASQGREAVLASKVASLQAAAGQSASEAVAAAAELASVTQRCQHADAEVDRLQMTVSTMKSALHEREAVSQTMQVQLEAAHERVRVLEAQVRTEHAALLRSELQAQAAAQTQQAAQAESDGMRALIDEVRAERARLEVQLEESNGMCEQLLQSNTSADSELRRVLLQLTQAKALHREACRQVEALRDESNTVRKAHSAELRRLQAQHEASRAESANAWLDLTAQLTSTLDVVNTMDARAVRLQNAQQERLAVTQAATQRLSDDLSHRLTFWMRCTEKLEASGSRLQDRLEHIAAAATRHVHANELQALVAQLHDQLAAASDELKSARRECDRLTARETSAAAAHRDEMARLRDGCEESLKDHIRRLNDRLQQVEAEMSDLRQSSALEREAAKRMQARLEADARAQVDAHSQQRVALEHERRVVSDQLAILNGQHQRAMEMADRVAAEKLQAEAQQVARLRGACADAVSSVRGIWHDLTLADECLLKARQAPALYHGQLSDADGDGAIEETLQHLIACVHRFVRHIQQALARPRKQVVRTTVFPAYSEQERSLRATLDKLVKVEESLETHYSCLACLNIFDNPVTCVPCGHTYCRRCLEAAAGPGGALLCGECGDARVESIVTASNLDHLACKFAFKMAALHDLQAMCNGVEASVVVDA